MENHDVMTPEEAMARDVEWLLERREEEGWRWTGRQCELVELVYAAAQTGLLLATDGNRPTVGRLAGSQATAGITGTGQTPRRLSP
ncbi:MAG TPA: hypothetical protein H9966_03545 [Candidatus Prevotella avicola]|uniref:Uncharacterized protein n=1 Tax=Candidatus Prevotella avicola TaxID=2838738 RepID=A0A9D2JWB0_9BACT|nr:hypothetical protein [Candidatus Prevotella avicola]